MIGSVLFALGIFICGIMIGVKLKTIAYEQQEWQILKWEPKVFAFRRAPIGTRLFKEDKIIMGLPIDVSQIDKEGVVVE